MSKENKKNKEDTNQDKKEENQLESDEQLSKEYRGDWSNIWEGM